jgi:hypothetical protein
MGIRNPIKIKQIVGFKSSISDAYKKVIFLKKSQEDRKMERKRIEKQIRKIREDCNGKIKQEVRRIEESTNEHDYFPVVFNIMHHFWPPQFFHSDTVKIAPLSNHLMSLMWH